MAWVAAAAIGGALITSNSVKGAAKTQAKSTDAAIAEQQRQYDLQREDFAPFREAGVDALRDLRELINRPTTAAEVMQDPGYQFGMDQGQQAIDRKIAAMGGRVSGAAIKAAGRFGTNYATSGYNAAYQRRQDSLNRLAALAGIGQTATGASAAAGTAAAGNISNLTTAQGNATAGAQVAQGNIWGNTANQIAALYSRNRPPASGGDFSSMATPDVGGINGGYGWKGGVGGF